ncbi:Peptidase C26 [Cinnamomum micranthum f. kanehirae]|uniref:folate gamma-glutamyl hydrolase n=1 Tax=Cinnamomum micranthum f. kanehirae TaxID=337451 RepID=A0A443PQG7_9MAGN|nr:Peptidase C26 [Cinnamomum micranthum f. kanehirae]
MNLRALGGVCFRSLFHSHFSRWLLFLCVFLEFSIRTEEFSRNSRREKRIKAFCNSNAQSILLPHQDRSFLRSAGVSSCPMPDPSLYFRPVVGILTHPGDGASGRLNNATNASYIAASYVKFVESAGARVIPLIYNEPKEILAEKLNLVNGVLLTGGWAETAFYMLAVALIKLEMPKDAADMLNEAAGIEKKRQRGGRRS